MDRIKFRNKSIIFFTVLLILSTACNKKEIVKKIDSKEKFQENVESIIDAVNSHNIHPSVTYHSYVVDDDHIFDYLDFDYDLSGFNIKNGVIVKMNNNLYLSLETDEYCAVKDLEDDDFQVYNIDEKEKCHKLHITDNEFKLRLLPSKLETNVQYTPNTVSQEFVQILAVTNLIDEAVITYQWYRNNEKIENSNVQNYVIASDFEDADYYVEIMTPDGNKYKSESVNVKISK